MFHPFRIPSHQYSTVYPTPTLSHFSSAKSFAPCSPIQQASCKRWGGRRMSSPVQLGQKQFQMAIVEGPFKGENENRQVGTVKSFQIGQSYADGCGLPAVVSPSHLAKSSPRICFTYKQSSLHNYKSQITTKPPPLQRNLSSGRNPLFQIRTKAERCNFSSKQFAFSYVPSISKKIQDCKCTLTHTLRTISLQDDTETALNRSDRTGCHSKVASTIASSEIPLRNSDFSLSNSTNRQNSSEIGQQSVKNLLDCIPSKQLGRTIMLPEYTFGGLIEQSSLKQAPQQMQMRQWDHFLLGGCDMKESIHCGPELRSEHKFQMLDQYGREIKESMTSFCE